MIRHYVEYLYLYPGTVIHKTIIQEILERNLEAIDISDGCTAFRFFDREEFLSNWQMKNVSGWHYCNCEKITFEEAKKIFYGNVQYLPLKEYMEAKNLKYIVKTKSRHYIPLRDIDTIL